MPTYVKRKMTPEVERELKNLSAKVEQQEAVLDYFSAMSGIDIPEEEEADGEDEI